MDIDITDLKMIVRYVSQHPDCSYYEIEKAFPNVKDLRRLLSEASEGAVLGEGCFLCQKNGLYRVGPSAYLLNIGISDQKGGVHYG